MAEQSVEDAYRFLRTCTTADLRFDENLRPLRFVIGPDGRLVAPVMYAMLDAVDTVLFVPEYQEDAMEVQVTLSLLDLEGPQGGLTDRWRIYHGEPEYVHWAVLDIDAARYHDWVLDGISLVRPNPLAAEEAGLCRRLNEDRDTLRLVCQRAADTQVENPTLVGVDPLGFDVRRRFDVIRLPAPRAMTSADEVERVLAEMSSDE